jgi:hypothetical protein
MHQRNQWVNIIDAAKALNIPYNSLWSSSNVNLWLFHECLPKEHKLIFREADLKPLNFDDT